MSYRAFFRAIPLFACILCARLAIAQDLPGLLSRFTSEHDRARKEEILNTITRQHPEAGNSLLKIARETKDTDTEWFAIRGIGSLKFKGASPFLRRSLLSESAYVRANSARALGEIHDRAAEGGLIRLLRSENVNGVIEQASLALQTLGARTGTSCAQSEGAAVGICSNTWVDNRRNRSSWIESRRAFLRGFPLRPKRQSSRGRCACY